MDNLKSDSEILAEIYRNAQLAQVSITDLLPEVEDEEIKEELLREHEEYEKICSQAAHLATRYELDLKEPSPIKRAMMWSAIKMNAATDNSRQNIAQMMIKGTVNGITSLKTSLTDGEKIMNTDVKNLLTDLISIEEGFERKLKSYL
ncbi:MAG: hypothetical protein K2O81_05400 [Clostridia bacterium]|nr:hypothetical protein [Clostridia bacterium]